MLDFKVAAIQLQKAVKDYEVYRDALKAIEVLQGAAEMVHALEQRKVALDRDLVNAVKDIESMRIKGEAQAEALRVELQALRERETAKLDDIREKLSHEIAALQKQKSDAEREAAQAVEAAALETQKAADTRRDLQARTTELQNAFDALQKKARSLG